MKEHKRDGPTDSRDTGREYHGGNRGFKAGVKRAALNKAEQSKNKAVMGN